MSAYINVRSFLLILVVLVLLTLSFLGNEIAKEECVSYIVPPTDYWQCSYNTSVGIDLVLFRIEYNYHTRVDKAILPDLSDQTKDAQHAIRFSPSYLSFY
jgi:hypothetical protein